MIIAFSQLLDVSEGEEAGYKSVTWEFKGRRVGASPLPTRRPFINRTNHVQSHPNHLTYIHLISCPRRFAYGLFLGEKGTHRLVRISPFNAKGARQTSFAGAGRGWIARTHPTHSLQCTSHPPKHTQSTRSVPTRPNRG